MKGADHSPRHRRRAMVPRVAVSPTVSKVYVWFGTLFLITSFTVLAVGVSRMSSAMDEMSFANVSDTNVVVDEISKVTAKLGKASDVITIGQVPLLVGAALYTIPLWRHRYRSRWFFWCTLGFGIAILAWVPIGSCIGLTWLVYLFVNRDEFPIGNVKVVELVEPSPVNH